MSHVGIIGCDFGSYNSDPSGWAGLGTLKLGK
jgi:hypothetical protein